MVQRLISIKSFVKSRESEKDDDITREEFGQFFDEVGIKVPERALNAFFKEADADKDRVVECSAMSKKKIVKSLESAVQTVVKDASALRSGCEGPNCKLPDRDKSKLVAVVAHNEMKPPMVHFVSTHMAFFQSVRIVATNGTGRALKSTCNIDVEHSVCSGPLGGDQEIGGMISRGEVAAVFFFIDPLSAHCHEADIYALNRICNVYDCLCAHNPSTADALIYSAMNTPAVIERVWPGEGSDVDGKMAYALRAYSKRQQGSKSTTASSQ
jgi:methylglyoxal synthase